MKFPVASAVAVTSVTEEAKRIVAPAIGASEAKSTSRPWTTRRLPARSSTISDVAALTSPAVHTTLAAGSRVPSE